MRSVATLQASAKNTLVAVGGVYLLCMAAGSQGGDYPIAGVNPDRRPDGAPVITDVVKDGQWYTQALTGVESPYPASLRFLEDQGNWFTPFSHPGMTGRYDLRHWHGR